MNVSSKVWAMILCAAALSPKANVGAQALETPAAAADEPTRSSAVIPPEAALQLPARAAGNAEADAASEFPAGRGLRFNFRGVQLQRVLDYMSDAANFIIQLKPGVSVTGTVDVWSAQPLNKAEAVALLKQVLNESGYTALENGRTLTIIRSKDAPTSPIPVRLGNIAANIPNDAEIVTQIIPVRTLNPVELVKVLTPLLSSGIPLNADESANALVMTATQAEIRRIVEIIAALDSVSATANSLHVFPLRYADAKEVAAIVKELFPAAEAVRGTAGAALPGRFPGGRGTGGARGFNPLAMLGVPGGSQADDGATPTSRVTAVADDHSNALIVSAPESLIPTIEQLVKSVDVSVQDLTDTEIFPLENADASEMADLLSSLYSDDSNSADATRATIQVQGQGGRGGQSGGARQGNGSAASAPSGHMQKMDRVLAVPDRRTGWLLVTASTSLMPRIRQIVNRLDANTANIVRIHVRPLDHEDPSVMLAVLRDIFPSSSASISALTLTDPLASRMAAMIQAQLQLSGNGTSIGSAIGSRGAP